MEEIRRGRKRKQCSEWNPFVGIITRSKSQVYCLRNRSGAVRNDSRQKQNHGKSLEMETKPKNRPAIFPAGNAAPVRDLRARRIFSPGSVVEEDGGNDFDLEIDIKSEVAMDLNPSPLEDLAGNSEISSEIVVNCSAVEENHGEKHISEMNLKGNEADSPERCVQTTPLEQELDEIKVSGDKIGVVSSLEEPNNVDTAKASDSKARNSRIKRKVFRSPSSFSYRRLLPFLMGIAKDESCCSEIEIVDVVLPRKILKSDNIASSTMECMVAGKVEEICTEYSKAADDGGNNDTKICEEQNASIISHMTFPTQQNVGPVGQLKCQENGFNAPMEESNPTTPPDTDIFGNLKVNESFSNIEGNLLHNKDNIVVNASNGSIARDGSITIKSSPPESRDSISTSKFVLNPCSVTRQVTAPSSMSHRRLLPFLMKNAKDDSHISIVSKSPKHENNLEQGPQPNTSTHTDIHGYKDLYVVESKRESSSGKHHCGEELPNFHASVSTTLHSSDEMTTGSSNVRLASTTGTFDTHGPSELLTGITADHIPLNTQKVFELEFKLANLGSPGKLEQVLPVPSAVSICSVTDDETLLDEPAIKLSQTCPPDADNHPGELTTSFSKDGDKPVITSMDQNLSQAEDGTVHDELAIQLSHSSPLGADNNHMGLTTSFSKDGVEPIIIDQNLSQAGAYDKPGGTHVGGLRKGILRKNPRGCRGLCNCLNCASFHLHAERAFEFSKNQMQDAEELALDLINELADLRSILEESITDPNDIAIFREKQIKEASAKALQAEELAKERLEQMNEDLGIHCRMTNLKRPRVTFANAVKVDVIAKTNPCRRKIEDAKRFWRNTL